MIHLVVGQSTPPKLVRIKSPFSLLFLSFFEAMTDQQLDTTELAAKATWEVLQGFLGGLGKIGSQVKSKSFNLWTESYGG